MKAKTKKVKKNTNVIYKLMDVHPNHDMHLCHIVGLRNMKTAARLAKDAKYICMICGRGAKNKKNLCEPSEI